MNETSSTRNPFDLSPEQRRFQLALLHDNIAAAIDRFEARIPKAENVEEMAWIARYLLDLHTWVKYCDHPDRAEQFWQDRIRDLNELNRVKDANNDPLEPATLALLEAAQTILTGSAKPFKPPYLHVAAGIVSSEFEGYRKQHDAILSKLAHPTALSLPLFSDPDRDEKWCELLRLQATGYVEEARRDLASSYLARVALSFSETRFRQFGPKS